MKLKTFKIGGIIDIKVKPNSSKSELYFSNELNIAYLKSVPIENKANEELIKLFKKEYKTKIEIISGHTSKNKRIKVIS